jgi:hypothetical protein
VVEKLHIDAADRQIELIEPDGGGATGIWRNWAPQG